MPKQHAIVDTIRGVPFGSMGEEELRAYARGAAQSADGAYNLAVQAAARRELARRQRATRKRTRKIPEPTFGYVFVALADGFLCEECARDAQLDLGSDDVQTWEVGGDGWLGPCVCNECKLSIPVIVNGDEKDED